jgi:hypothetical protein
MSDSGRDWSPFQVREYLQRQIDDMRTMLDERYATQTKAVDAAFVAQQTAMQTALTAQALAVQVAQTAQEKAQGKAETAAAERFDQLVEKLDAEALRSATQIAAISSRLDLSQGRYLAVAGFAALFGGGLAAGISKAIGA